MLYRKYLFLFTGFCLSCYHFANAQNAIAKNYSQLPIKPTRTISFTTDEGSYMDVQIAPDGKTILFDMLGSLFVMPSKGGEAKQITRGLAMNHSPAWSPDGRSIAYSSDASGDRRLHVINVDGSNDRVFDKDALSSNELINGIPQWLPDGKSILFGSFLYGFEGNKIAFKDAFKVNIPIIGFSNRDSFFYTQSDVIARYDRKSLQKTVMKTLRLKFDQGFFISNAKVSEDGYWLTYLERRNSNTDSIKLIAYGIKDEKERILAVTSIEYSSYKEAQYSISSDSKNVFIGYGGKIHKIQLENGRDEVIPFNATVKADLGAFDYNRFRVSHDSFNVHYTRSANANPDGTQLVFSALNRVYIMNLPNGKPRLLAPQSEGQFCPCFSPDGKWIAYASWSDSAGGQVWRVPSVGGKPEQLTHEAARYQYINWSPDGKQIVAVKGDLGYSSSLKPYQGQIMIVSVDDAKQRFIADSIPVYNSPVFSSDGTAIICMKEVNQKFIKKSVESSVIKDLVTIRSNTFGQLVVSPDERFIACTKNESLFLFRILEHSQPLVIDDTTLQRSSIRFSDGGFDPHWEKGGKILSWSYGNKYYQIDPDKIVVAANKLSHDRSNSFANTESSNLIKCKVQPDRAVTIKLVEPRNYARGTIVLKNARIITIQGDKVIERGTIIIRDGRILDVNDINKIKIPASAVTIDVSGKTIMPGFVDLHLHYSIGEREVFPQRSWQYLINLAYGVTTARNPATGPLEYVGSELVEAGALIGPRLYPSGEPIGGNDISSFDNALSIVNNHAVRNGTFIKQYLLDTRRQREWLLMASMKAGLNMTNEGYHDPLEYLGQVKDGSTGVEHSAAWGNVYNDVIKFLALSGTFLTPTLQERWEGAHSYFRNLYFKNLNSKLKRFTPARDIAYNLSEYSPKDSLQSFFKGDAAVYTRIFHEGGNIGMGSHGNYLGIGEHFEIWALQMGGMTNIDALRCATLTGAEAIGIQKDLGSIEVGKIADLIILDKNPLEDIHNTNTIKYVMKDGILYDGNTLDQIWPEKKKCPEWRMKQ